MMKEKKIISAGTILAAVGKGFDKPLEKLLDPNVRLDDSTAQKAAIYLIRKDADLDGEDARKLFRARRNTIPNSVRSILSMMRRDPTLRAKIENIRREYGADESQDTETMG